MPLPQLAFDIQPQTVDLVLFYLSKTRTGYEEGMLRSTVHTFYVEFDVGSSDWQFLLKQPLRFCICDILWKPKLAKFVRSESVHFFAV